VDGLGRGAGGQRVNGGVLSTLVVGMPRRFSETSVLAVSLRALGKPGAATHADAHTRLVERDSFRSLVIAPSAE